MKYEINIACNWNNIEIITMDSVSFLFFSFSFFRFASILLSSMLSSSHCVLMNNQKQTTKNERQIINCTKLKREKKNGLRKSWWQSFWSSQNANFFKKKFLHFFFLPSRWIRMRFPVKNAVTMFTRFITKKSLKLLHYYLWKINKTELAKIEQFHFLSIKFLGKKILRIIACFVCSRIINYPYVWYYGLESFDKTSYCFSRIILINFSV